MLIRQLTPPLLKASSTDSTDQRTTRPRQGPPSPRQSSSTKTTTYHAPSLSSLKSPKRLTSWSSHWQSKVLMGKRLA